MVNYYPMYSLLLYLNHINIYIVYYIFKSRRNESFSDVAIELKNIFNIIIYR